MRHRWIILKETMKNFSWSLKDSFTSLISLSTFCISPLKVFFFLIFWNKTGRLVVWRSCTKPAAMCYSEKGQNAFQTITRALSHLRPIREQMGWKIALYLHCALIWPNLKTNLQCIVLDSHRILLKSKQYHISGVFVASGISMRAPYLFSLPWYAFITAWI